MNKYISNFKDRLINWGIKGTDRVVISSKELIRLQLIELNVKKPITVEHLTMKQLGSYVPNFEMLSSKTDSFKNDMGIFCSNLLKSSMWTYLINHLKQDQVNLSLFSDDKSAPNRNDNFTRGSINGIYVVEDQISTLGIFYDDQLKKKISTQK